MEYPSSSLKRELPRQAPPEQRALPRFSCPAPLLGKGSSLPTQGHIHFLCTVQSLFLARCASRRRRGMKNEVEEALGGRRALPQLPQHVLPTRSLHKGTLRASPNSPNSCNFPIIFSYGPITLPAEDVNFRCPCLLQHGMPFCDNTHLTYMTKLPS